MQTTEDTDRSACSSVPSVSGAKPHAQSGILQQYWPGQPHVLTDDLKAQLAASNQQRRVILYPGLMQSLANSEPGNQSRDQFSEERALSLQQLAAANKARRNKLRESGHAFPMPSTA